MRGPCENQAVKSGWRPAVVAAVASVLLTGCGAEITSSGCSASMTKSPDWVFGLLLSSGLVALFSGGAWVGFLPGLVTGPPRPAPKRWWSPGGRAQMVLSLAFVAYAAYNSRDMWTQTPDGYIQAASVGFLALIMGGIVAASRRYRATGVWPSGRQTPWGFFWVLPVSFLVAASNTVWAFVTMAGSSVSIPCQ
jgi:hypothetical protein